VALMGCPERVAKKDISMTNSDTAMAAPKSKKRKLWWVLPLAVLLVLIGVIYFLGHMGAADAEIYRTTQRQADVRVRFS
jgi:hypothetical protein